MHSLQIMGTEYMLIATIYVYFPCIYMKISVHLKPSYYPNWQSMPCNQCTAETACAYLEFAQLRGTAT